jgi:hypothetical protein
LLGQGSSGAASSVEGNPGSGGSANLYGGGGNGWTSDSGRGAVRILWGTNRAYPSTNTGDM